MRRLIILKIHILDFIHCFQQEYKYHYFGGCYNIFKSGSENHKLLNEFLTYVDSEIKPKWCPRFVLNLLHLFGNDNSIVRVRNRILHELLNRLTGGVLILDIKIKFGTLRIYFSCASERIYLKLKELEDKINPTLEAY